MAAQRELMVFTVMVGVASLLIAGGFLVLVWRISWCLKGYVATELQRSRYEERIVAMLHDYIEGQHTTNEQIWSSMQVHADRINRLASKKSFGGIKE